jgi:hypothetical protein
MKVGQKISVQPAQLFAKHPGIRFDSSQIAASHSAPRGASGYVRQISHDGKEALVEISWNINPRGAPGSGEHSGGAAAAPPVFR